MASRLALSGHLQVSGGATQEKLKNFGGEPPWGGRANPQNWRPSTFSSRRAMRALPPARFMALRGEPGNLDCAAGVATFQFSSDGVAFMGWERRSR